MKETDSHPTDCLYQNPSLSLLTTSLQASSIKYQNPFPNHNKGLER